MYRKIAFILFVFLIIPFFSISLLSCDKKEKKKIDRGGTLVKGVLFELGFLNPVLSFSGPDSNMVAVVFDGLQKADESGELFNNLARKIEVSQDQRVWDVTIQEGVLFHDGVELTAEDVKFTYDSVRDPKISRQKAKDFEEIQDIEVIEKYHLRFTLKEPHSSFKTFLDLGILPAHLLKGRDMRKESLALHPVGTGPYKVAERTKERVVLNAYDGYFKGRPNIDHIEIKRIDNHRTAWALLMKGELDYFDGSIPEDFQVLEKISTIQTYRVLKPYYYLISFNMKHPLLSKKEVRLALNYAINRERLMKGVLNNEGEIMTGTIFPHSWAYDENIPPFPYDPLKSVELLKEEGLEGGVLTLTAPAGDRLMAETLHYLKKDFAEIGIEVKMEFLSLKDMKKRLFEKKFDMSFMYMRGDSPEISYQFWHSSGIERGFNFFSFKIDEVDYYLDKARTAVGKKERKAAYWDFQKTIRNDPPGIFLFWANRMIGIHNRFKNVHIGQEGMYATVTKWYVPKSEQIR